MNEMSREYEFFSLKVNIGNDINFRVSTDRFVSTGTVSITRHDLEIYLLT